MSDSHDTNSAPPNEAADRGTSPKRPMSPLRSIILYTRGLIISQYVRRLTMFYVVIAAMLMAFAGDVVLKDWLDAHQHLTRFALYWLICGWLTLLAALLALYDLLLLRIQHRIVRRQLRERMLSRGPKPDADGDGKP